MPAGRKLLTSSSGKLLVSASGQLADPACCCGECAAPTTLCCFDFPDPEFPTSEEWATNPEFTDDWNVNFCPVPLLDTGFGYYQGAVDVVTQHNPHNGLGCPLGNEFADFAITISVRLYPIGDRWHLAAVGAVSGFFYPIYFFADLSPAQAAAGGSFANQITECSGEVLTTADDIALWTPLLVGDFLVAAFGGSITITLP